MCCFLWTLSKASENKMSSSSSSSPKQDYELQSICDDNSKYGSKTAHVNKIRCDLIDLLKTQNNILSSTRSSRHGYVSLKNECNPSSSDDKNTQSAQSTGRILQQKSIHITKELLKKKYQHPSAAVKNMGELNNQFEEQLNALNIKLQNEAFSIEKMFGTKQTDSLTTQSTFGLLNELNSEVGARIRSLMIWLGVESSVDENNVSVSEYHLLDENKSYGTSFTEIEEHLQEEELKIMKLLYLNEKTPRAIIQAIETGNISVIEKLLPALDDINGKDAFGNTSLFRVAEIGDVSTAEYLFLLNADVNIACNWGKTALHIAAELGHAAIVQTLLTLQADVNSKADWGRTPLHLAASNGHEKTVDLLVEYGAQILDKEILGKTAIDLAKMNGHEKTFDLLVFDKNSQSMDRFFKN